MIQLIAFAYVLIMAFHAYKSAKQNGQWSWTIFLGLIGSVGAFLAVFVLPVAQSATLQKSKVWMITILLTGILLYMVALIFFVRWGVKRMQAGKTPP